LVSAKWASNITKSTSLPLRVSGSGDQTLPQRPDSWNLNVTPSNPRPSAGRALAIDLSHSERSALCNSSLMTTVLRVVRTSGLEKGAFESDIELIRAAMDTSSASAPNAPPSTHQSTKDRGPQTLRFPGFRGFGNGFANRNWGSSIKWLKSKRSGGEGGIRTHVNADRIQ